MALPADAASFSVMPDLGGLAAEILDRLQDGFYAIDREWRLIHANRRACAMWGASSREAIVGRILWDCFPQFSGSDSDSGRSLRHAVEAGRAAEFAAFCPVLGRPARFRVEPLKGGVTGVFFSWDGGGGQQRDGAAAATEEARRADEERLHIASETARLGYWERDLASGELWSSAGCKANYGLLPNAELSYEMVFAAIDPAYRDSVREASRRAVREHTDYAAEYPITWPDGSRHWIAVRGRCLYGADGSPLRNVGVTIDITERKEAEEALRASEERLQLAQQGAGIGVWDWNLATGQIYWSPQMFRLFCLDPVRDAKAPYRAWLRVIHPDDRERAHAHVQRYRREAGPREFEFRIIARGGAVRWILVKGTAVTLDQQGRPVRVAGVNIDITERKRVEAALRELTEGLEARVEQRTRELAEANERLRRERLFSELIIESTAEGIIVLDTELRHVVWNRAIEDINGLPRREVLGKTLFEVTPHLVDHPVGHAWREALAGRRAEIRDYRFLSLGRGAEIVYDADFTPLYDQHGGAIIGAICILRETTERHRMEEMLRQSQKLEAVAQLTGGVAHDFNNLLTAVIGCLDMIQRETADKRILGLAETALRSADRGTQLTHQLLAFARRQALQPVTADLNALLAEIEVLVQRAVGESIDVVVERAPGLWCCEVDPAQFEAAVMNLVINARDAMPRGGRVRLTTRNLAAGDIPGDVDVRPGEYVAFSVQDGGEGMEPAVAARAFEPFFTTKEIGKGSGLGLSMVYGFAKQSGGGVRLDSAPGVGTCVTLYLPRALSAPANAAADQARSADHQQVRHGSGAILVVEDDEDVREMSVAMLCSLGYRVLVARDGQEALDIVQRRSERIDLLFTDLVMPRGISGVALARRAQSIRPGLRVLLTTGYAGVEALEGAEFPLITKPFRPTELGRIVADLIGDDRQD